MTEAYEDALAASAAASAIFAQIAADYRAQKIGDTEYLAGRAAHEAAQAAFDIAYEAACNEPEADATIIEDAAQLSLFA